MPVVLQRNPGQTRATLQDLLETSRLDTLLVVVPTKRRIRHLTREVLSLARGGVSPALPIYTLESLAIAIVQASRHARKLVNGTLQTLLFERALEVTREMLGYFAPKARERRMFQGTFDKIVDVVNSLNEAGVYPDLLEEEAGEAPLDEQQKLLDVAAIYRAYNEQLELNGATDLGGIYRFIHAGSTQEEFQELFRNVFPSVETLSLAGFDEFTVPEISFIRRLSSTPGISVALLFDFQHGNRGLFGHLEDNYRRLTEIGFREEPTRGRSSMLTIGPRSRPEAATSTIDHLSRTLFKVGPVARRTDSAGRVAVVRTENRLREIEWICKRIKMLALGQPGIELSSVCVAMVRPQPYTDIVREQFSRFGIPVNITDRYELHRSPVMISIMGLLQLALRGFRRDDLLRILESPYLGLTRAPLFLDAANIAQVSQQLRLTAGYRIWIDRISSRLQILREKTSPTQAGSRRSSAEREIQSLEKALDDLASLQRHIRPLLSEHSPRQFMQRVQAVLESLGVSRRILSRSHAVEGDRIERDMRAYARFSETMREMADLLSFQWGASARHPLRRYVEHLKLAISRERFNIREEFGRGVLVTSIDETRGLSMNIMFVAGLVDGEFPSVYQPEIFLSTGRQKLREQRHNWQNRYLFYQAVTNWSERLVLTYPEREGDIQLVRSPFVDAIMKVADVELIDASDRSSSPEILCAEDEALQWFARSGHDAGWQTEVSDHQLALRLEEVDRVIAIERSRMADHTLKEYEGLVFEALPERLQERLKAYRGATYSVSQLETYAECPFRFFAERVLGLGVTEDFREELTPLEHGSILHEALFEFYTARREQDLPALWRCTEEEFQKARDQLVGIVEAKLSSYEIPDAFWEIDKEELLGRRGGSGGVLQEFLEQERRRKVEPAPRFFEVAFGAPPGSTYDSTLSRDDPVTVGHVRLKGKVDRVDLAADHFTIFDYKTGRKLPTARAIRDGLSLQLPLYLLAVEHLLGGEEKRDCVPAGALYYQIRNPVRVRAAVGNAEYRQRAFDSGDGTKNISESGEELRSVLRISLAAAEAYVDGIASGSFPLVDAGRVDDTCRYCDHKTMCRIQSARRVHSSDRENS